jgi:hypothetical protein
MVITDEQDALGRLVFAMPVFISLTDIMKTESLYNAINEIGSVKDIECQINFPSCVFFELAKIVDKNVTLLNQARMEEEEPIHTNESVLSRLLGQLIMLGLIDLINNQDKHKKLLVKEMIRFVEKIEA